VTPLSRRRLLQLSGGLALAAGSSAFAQSASVADLKGDVALLREAFTTIHPAIYSYNTPAGMAARFDLLEAEWASPGSFEDRLLSLSRLTAAVRCGHTYPNPWNQSQSVQASMFEGRRGVPFEFLWLDGAMVVTRDRSSAGLFSRGDAIIAINGVATSELLCRLMLLSRADGSADAKRVNNMEMRGDNRFEAFDLHLPLVLRGVSDEAAFTLQDGRTVRAGLLTLAERQSSMAAATNDDTMNPWTLATGDDGIVRLTCPTWALYDATWDWRGWLAATMDDLTANGARGLIIDLRGNEGGLSACGDIIASRLISADIETPRGLKFVRYKRVDPALNPYLSTWDNSFRDWGERAVGPNDQGFYRLTDEDDTTSGIVRPAGRRFRGPVIVLCDASNSSATFGFAQMVKDNGLATLVGPATGGTRRGVNGGYFFMRLPASGLEVDLPHTAIVPRTPQPDEPVQPDLVIGFSRADIAAGRDPQMAAAIARILSA
jgi:hypothetical protein